MTGRDRKRASEKGEAEEESLLFRERGRAEENPKPRRFSRDVERKQVARFPSRVVPSVGTVLSTSPMCSLYRMVVFPAASSPSITTRISLFPNSLSNACLNDLNTVCADGAFPIVAGRFRRRTRATTRLRRAERAPSRRLPRPLSPREPRESPSASGGRARGPGAPTAPDLARRRLTRTGGTKRVQCDDDDSTAFCPIFSRSLVSVSKTLVERLIACGSVPAG